MIDEIVELLIAAPTRASLVARVRALDRVLQWSFLVVPHWHIEFDRVAVWDKFGMPKTIPVRGVVTNAWWIDDAKAAALATKKKPAN